MMKKKIIWMVCLVLLSCHCLNAQEENELTEEQIAAILGDSICGEKGSINHPAQHFGINVPEGYVYLNKEKATRLLVDYWGNPADDEILGVLLSDTAHIYANADIAYIIYYMETGYVSDKDAKDIDYDDLLVEMKKEIKETSDNLSEEYMKYELVDWAVSPKYDAEKKTLVWAKHLRFGGEHETLNYDIRILGKQGVVIMQAVADMADCAQVVADEDLIVSSVQFNSGYAYSDFNPATDHVAEWTIGGLIAGKVMAKAGLFAKLGIFLAKFWKIIAFAVLAIGAPLFKYFKKKNKEQQE